MNHFDVTQFGAKPDGSDSYAAIQAAVNAWKRYGGRLHFPKGIYGTSQTIDLGGSLHEVGGIITCDGVSDETLCYLYDRNAQHPDNSLTNNGTAVLWRGKNKAGPIFRYSGSHLIWDGPSLWGDVAGAAETGNRPTAGLEVLYTEGIGAGKMDMRQLSGSKLPIVVHANGGTNVDQFDVKRFLMHDVDVGFRAESVQNVGNVFGFVIAQHVHKAVFSFAELTHTIVHHAVLNHTVDCFLHTEHSDYMAGLFSCNSIKVDPESPQTLLLDSADRPHTFGSYTFRDVSGWLQGTTIKASGACIITLDNCRAIYGDGCFELSGSKSAECQVLITRSHLPNSMSSKTLVKGDGNHCRVTIKDCFGDRGQPRPDEFSLGGQTHILSDLQLVN